MTSGPMTHEQITLGGGCFWCLEAVFLRLKGVLAVESGYCNGQIDAPSYEQVCSGRSGHAEVVQISFDPSVLSLSQLLEVFFAIHDPTTLNRQGADVGSQYRSGIYWHDPAQLAIAVQAVGLAQSHYLSPIVTELQARQRYFSAEAYHQRYFEQNPEQAYCAFVVAPKVGKFEKAFAHLLKARA